MKLRKLRQFRSIREANAVLYGKSEKNPTDLGNIRMGSPDGKDFIAVGGGRSTSPIKSIKMLGQDRIIFQTENSVYSGKLIDQRDLQDAAKHGVHVQAAAPSIPQADIFKARQAMNGFFSALNGLLKSGEQSGLITNEDKKTVDDALRSIAGVVKKAMGGEAKSGAA